MVCYALIFHESTFRSPNSNGCHHKSQHVWKWKMASHFQGTFSTSSTSPGPLAFYYFNSISFFISTCLLGTNQLHSSDTHSDTNMTQSGLSSVNTLLTEPSPAERYAFIPKLAACHREFPAF